MNTTKTESAQATHATDVTHVTEVSHAPHATDLPRRGANPRYSLRKGLGVWELVLAGQPALLKHEQGIFYVAWLLTHPPQEPIHAVALAAKALAYYDDGPVATTITDPATGRTLVVERNATLQQRNLALDDAEAAARLRRKQHELEAILDDEDQIEPVKAEARRDLAAICAFQRKHLAGYRGSTERCVRSIGFALRRFHRRLANAVDGRGNPHPVLRPFAEHLRQHLLIPSGRAAGHGGIRAHSAAAGCLTYEPPTGVVWVG